MNTYVLALLAASLGVALIRLLAPKGEGGRLGDHVDMIAGLFLLVSLLEPLKAGITLLYTAAEGDLADQLPITVPAYSEEDYAEVLNSTLLSVGKTQAEVWVSSALQDRFGIPPMDCRISVSCAAEGENLTVSEVRVALSGSSITQNPHPIEAYITDSLGCPCYVTVELP